MSSRPKPSSQEPLQFSPSPWPWSLPRASRAFSCFSSFHLWCFWPSCPSGPTVQSSPPEAQPFVPKPDAGAQVGLATPRAPQPLSHNALHTTGRAVRFRVRWCWNIPDSPTGRRWASDPVMTLRPDQANARCAPQLSLFRRAVAVLRRFFARIREAHARRMIIAQKNRQSAGAIEQGAFFPLPRGPMPSPVP